MKRLLNGNLMFLCYSGCTIYCGESGAPHIATLPRRRLGSVRATLGGEGMDIHIGPIDGFEATRIIRNVSPRSKVIGLSGSALSSYAKKMKALGALGYVTKCSSLEEMTSAINTAMKGEFYYCSVIRKILYNEEKLGMNATTNADLTKRELEIIELVKQGMDGHEIAQRLHISRHTVYNHQNSIYKKLKVSNATAMIHAAHLKGI